MSVLRQTVLRLVICGFLTALCVSLFSESRQRRLMRFVGGCFLAVVVLQPLLESNLFSMLETLRPALPEETYSYSQEKNERLLKELIEKQTAEWIEDAARELGTELRAEVVAEADADSGLFIPAHVTLRGVLSAEQQAALSERIAKELAIPIHRQRWESG